MTKTLTGGDKSLNICQIMLAIGVDLNGMGGIEFTGFDKTGFYCRALAAIVTVFDKVHAGFVYR